jgi:hypothetical protein
VGGYRPRRDAAAAVGCRHSGQSAPSAEKVAETTTSLAPLTHQSGRHHWRASDAPQPRLVEMRTAAGPSSVVQWVLSGGPNTTASHARQCQVVCPPPPCPKAGDVPDEDLIRSEGMPVRAAGGWSGDPFPGRRLYQLAQHEYKPMRSRGDAWSLFAVIPPEVSLRTRRFPAWWPGGGHRPNKGRKC